MTERDVKELMEGFHCDEMTSVVCRYNITGCSDCNFTIAKDMVIKALEKQIPKKPCRVSEIDDNDNAMVECPICHANSDYSINTIKSGYCWKCGQKLDWGE